jgi:hypothetical protein
MGQHLTLLAVFICFTSPLSATSSTTPEAPYGLCFAASATSVVIWWHYPGVCRQSYRNDGNEVNQYFLVAEDYRSNRVAPVFRGLDNQQPIEAISVFIWGEDLFPALAGDPNSRFALSLRAALPGRDPGPALWEADTVAAAAVGPDGSWCEFPVHSQLDFSDSLYAVIAWFPETPTAPLFAVDYQPGGRSNTYFGYESAGDYVWRLDYGADLLLRLLANGADTGDHDGIDIGVDSFSLFLAGDSLTCLPKPYADITIQDSLHLTIPFPEVSGRYVSVAAWRDGLNSHRSRVLQIGADQLPPHPLPVTVLPESLMLLMPPDTVGSTKLLLTNTGPIPLEVCMEVDSLSRDWLQVDSVPFLLEASGQQLVSVIATSFDLRSGDHFATICLNPALADSTYLPLTIPVRLRVDVPTGVCESTDAVLPAGRLLQNYPNPFNDRTTILSHSDRPIEVYSIIGELVATLEVNGKAGGMHRFAWDGRIRTGRSAPSGVYLYRHRDGPLILKMLLLK